MVLAFSGYNERGGSCVIIERKDGSLAFDIVDCDSPE